MDDILLEMSNNRVDTPDRAERIANGVRDPLEKVVAGPLGDLRATLEGMVELAETPREGTSAAATSVQQAEQVLLALRDILDKMLDLESYNEVLDLVRDLMGNQEALIEETEAERKKAIQDLFRE